MKKLNNLSNYSYAKLISELIKLSHIHHYECKLIGEEVSENTGLIYPLYRFTINPSAKIKFCIIAGVHGYEIAGPLTVPSVFAGPKRYLNKNVCYYVYPVINPTAFDLRRRLDDDGFDLNTLDKKILRNKGFREIRAFYEDIKNKKFEVLISLHEDVDTEKFYAYIFEKDKMPVYRKIIQSAAKYAGILRKDKIYGTASDGMGLIINSHDWSLEDRLYCAKQAKISLCTETPGKLDLNTRIAINLNSIKTLNAYILKRIKSR